MNKIGFVQTKPIYNYYLSKTVYEFKKDKKYHWLQKLCIKILDKLGCQKQECKIDIEHIIVDKIDLLEKLFTCSNVLRREGKQPEMLLIGAEDFEKLTNAPRVRDSLVFDLQYSQHYGSKMEILGMKIVVVPWMHGILPITKDLLK